MRFRKLRIAWSVGCGIACVLLIVLWVRGSHTTDLLYQKWNSRLYCLESYDGRLTYWHINRLIIRDPSVTAHAEAENVHGFINAIYENNSRFGFIRRTSNGPIAFAPHWVSILLIGASSTLPWINKMRFSLRTLLIATTLVSILLGVAVYFSTRPPASPPLNVGDFDKGKD